MPSRITTDLISAEICLQKACVLSLMLYVIFVYAISLKRILSCHRVTKCLSQTGQQLWQTLGPVCLSLIIVTRGNESSVESRIKCYFCVTLSLWLNVASGAQGGHVTCLGMCCAIAIGYFHQIKWTRKQSFRVWWHLVCSVYCRPQVQRSFGLMFRITLWCIARGQLLGHLATYKMVWSLRLCVVVPQLKPYLRLSVCVYVCLVVFVSCEL